MNKLSQNFPIPSNSQNKYLKPINVFIQGQKSIPILNTDTVTKPAR